MTRRPPVLPVVLFVLTAATTTLAHGPLYAAALLAILGAHEMGHFVMCRRHGVRSTWPLFLPLPLAEEMSAGTLGAVIKIRSPFPSRKALFDIAAAGPIAGLVVAIPVTLVGLELSEVVAAGPQAATALSLGESLIVRALAWLVFGNLPAGQDLSLHPIAFAGWFGLFMTGLNLLPIGQLDGGHVVYALAGPARARRSTALALAAFAALTLAVYNYWILFLVLVAVFARRHPAPLDDWTPLDAARRRIGYATLGLFVLTFTPVPIAGIPSLWTLLHGG